MMYTLWAYIIATIGMGCGIFVILKGYKWKIGTWIICISLSVFVGGKLQIENLVSNTFNITERLGGIESKIQELEVTVNQTVALKNEMSQTVNVITEVKKEIENIHEAIAQIYENVESETFKQKDLNKKVRVFDTEVRRVVYFQLDKTPIDKSVRVSGRNGLCSPAAISIISNIVLLRTEAGKEDILTKEHDFFLIQYSQDHGSEEPLLTLKDMQYKGTKENPNRAILQGLAIEKESNAESQSGTND